MSYETPTYELLDEPPFYVGDKYKCYSAKLTCECNWDDLSALVGTRVNGQEILAVERFAVQDQSYRLISLAVKDDRKVLDKA